MQSAQISQKQDGCNIHVILKTMWSRGYHHKGFVVTHALEDFSTTLVPTLGYTLLVPLKERVFNKPSKEHNISSHQGLF